MASPSSSVASELTSKARSVPIDHLSYDYIEKCSDGRELEKIVKSLRSGEDGRFPDLLATAEQCLAKHKPKSKLLIAQKPVMRPSDLDPDSREQIEDEMTKWENEAKSVDAHLKGQGQSEKELPPVRQPFSLAKEEEESSQQKEKPAKTIKSGDYRAWDKLDVHKLENDIDNAERKKDERKKRKGKQSPSPKNMPIPKDPTERNQVAQREKAKGNESFRAGDYQESVVFYSRSIDLRPLAVTYNNRAMAYLKQDKFREALKDANKVLELEPENRKALHRRAQCFKWEGRYLEAEADLKKVLEVEPNHAQVKQLLSEIQKARESKKKKGKRVSIVDVDSQEEEQIEPAKSRANSLLPSAPKKSTPDPSPPVQTPDSPALSAPTKSSPEPPPLAPSVPTPDSPPKSSPETSPATSVPTPEPPAAKSTHEPPPPSVPEAVLSFQEKANLLFKAGDYPGALEKYSKAINAMGDLHGGGWKNEIVASLLSNRAACHIRLGNLRSCIEDCDKGLEYNPLHSKLFLKRASAYESLENYGSAYVNYAAALSLDSSLARASQACSRLGQELRKKHGSSWRDRLPEQPRTSLSFASSLSNVVGPTSVSEEKVDTDGLSPVDPGPFPADDIKTESAVPDRSEEAQLKDDQKEGVETAESVEVKEEKEEQEQENDGNGKEEPMDTKEDHFSEGKEESQEAEQKEKLSSEELREKGKQLVQKGKYVEAIECYSKWIEIDPNEPTAYSNRAMCYLKQDKFQLATEDCDSALQLDPTNVKAFYRRAQARSKMGDYRQALQDLKSLLGFEPDNKPAKREMETAKTMWRKELREGQEKVVRNKKREKDAQKNDEASKAPVPSEAKQRQKRSPSPAQEKPRRQQKPESKRVRVQIQETNSDESSGEEEKAVGKEKTVVPSETSKAPAEVSQNNDEGKEVGFSDEEKHQEQEVPLSKAPPDVVLEKGTPYEFIQAWQSVRRRSGESARLQYASLLKQVKPENLPSILSNKLDGDMLGRMIDAVANYIIPEGNCSLGCQLLHHLSKAERFDVISMFLGSNDKKNLQKSLAACEDNQPSDITQDQLTAMRKAYQVKD